MWYALLADVVVAVHVAYVSYIIFGQLAILVGLVFRWQWIRNFWFRLTHLVMMSIVGVEAILNIACPLTRWEFELRRAAGQNPSEVSFVGRLLDSLIFFTAPPWVLAALHIGFAVLVIGTFVLAPPRWRRNDKPRERPLAV